MPGMCATSGADLSGKSAADVTVAGRCLHLGTPVADQLRSTSGSATPTADPLIWTLRFSLDQETARRLESFSGKAMFASVDGFPLGPTMLTGASFTATGHFDGRGTEARSVVSNIVYPIPIIESYSVAP